jgi:hypothetical protein
LSKCYSSCAVGHFLKITSSETHATMEPLQIVLSRNIIP